MLIHDKFYCGTYSNYDIFSCVTARLTKRQNVEFALYCAKDVFHLVNDEFKESTKLCLDLVEKWLVDENSVIIEEISRAVDIVYAHAENSHCAVGPVYAVVRSARAVTNASEDTQANASSVSTAAHAAAWAATNAYNAGNYNTRADKSNKLNEYLIIANSYLTKATTNCPNYEIEGKILYLIDELDENIIVHKDKYYVNMNGIEHCSNYGFSSQQELLNTLLYNKDRFWEFVRNWLDNLYKEEK